MHLDSEAPCSAHQQYSEAVLSKQAAEKQQPVSVQEFLGDLWSLFFQEFLNFTFCFGVPLGPPSPAGCYFSTLLTCITTGAWANYRFVAALGQALS
jgi:hypothetical protein